MKNTGVPIAIITSVIGVIIAVGSIVFAAGVRNGKIDTNTSSVNSIESRLSTDIRSTETRLNSKIDANDKRHSDDIKSINSKLDKIMDYIMEGQRHDRGI